MFNLHKNKEIAIVSAVIVAVLLWILIKRKMKKSYFTIDELCVTSQKGIDNTPTPEARKNLQQLIDNVLNPAREAYGQPIFVSSGYRSPAVNKAVGGVSNSQHMKGQAADLQTRQGTQANRALFNIIKRQGNFDQLINEYNYSWVHVSYNPNGNRGQILNIS